MLQGLLISAWISMGRKLCSHGQWGIMSSLQVSQQRKPQLYTLVTIKKKKKNTEKTQLNERPTVT